MTPRRHLAAPRAESPRNARSVATFRPYRSALITCPHRSLETRGRGYRQPVQDPAAPARVGATVRRICDESPCNRVEGRLNAQQDGALTVANTGAPGDRKR